MNDEDFARNAFRHAMESGFGGEPAGLPSLDDIAARARRGNRTKQGVYAASAVALAGVVTAGVVAGPTVLGLGAGSTGTSTAGQAGSTTPDATGTPPNKAKVATACLTPPQIDWAALISQQVAGIRVTPVSKASGPDHNTCYLMPDGSMNIEVLFDTGNPTAIIQIDVNTGGSKNGRASTPASSTTASSTPNASEQASLQALKSKLASEQATAKSPDATDQAQKQAIASKLAAEKPTGAATNSPATNAVKSPQATPTCTGDKRTQVICTIDVGKGGYVGMSAALTRTTPTPLFVQVIGSTSAPATPGQHAPLTSAQLSAIAQAVAAHF